MVGGFTVITKLVVTVELSWSFTLKSTEFDPTGPETLPEINPVVAFRVKEEGRLMAEYVNTDPASVSAAITW